MALTDDEVTAVLEKWRAEDTPLYARFLGGDGRLVGAGQSFSIADARIASVGPPMSVLARDKGTELVIDPKNARWEPCEHAEIPHAGNAPSGARWGQGLRVDLDGAGRVWLIELRG